MIIKLTPESSIIRSIFARCILDNGHFMWTGGVSRGGGRKGDPYPSVWVPELRTAIRGHRLIFAAFHGTWEVPIGYHREHVCNRSLCLNPACMELVTQEENQRRRAWRARSIKEGVTEMICPECKSGADMITSLHEAMVSGYGEVVSLLRSVIVSQHAKCRGGTWCDCRHLIPEAVA